MSLESDAQFLHGDVAALVAVKMAEHVLHRAAILVQILDEARQNVGARLQMETEINELSSRTEIAALSARAE